MAPNLRAPRLRGSRDGRSRARRAGAIPGGAFHSRRRDQMGGYSAAGLGRGVGGRGVYAAVLGLAMGERIHVNIRGLGAVLDGGGLLLAFDGLVHFLAVDSDVRGRVDAQATFSPRMSTMVISMSSPIMMVSSRCRDSTNIPGSFHGVVARCRSRSHSPGHQPASHFFIGQAGGQRESRIVLIRCGGRDCRPCLEQGRRQPARKLREILPHQGPKRFMPRDSSPDPA